MIFVVVTEKIGLTEKENHREVAIVSELTPLEQSKIQPSQNIRKGPNWRKDRERSGIPPKRPATNATSQAIDFLALPNPSDGCRHDLDGGGHCTMQGSVQLHG